jgi:hypothetical protein
LQGENSTSDNFEGYMMMMMMMSMIITIS